MSDDVPEELLRDAQRVVDDINLNDASAVPTIARALWAERKRCAEIARAEMKKHDTGSGFDSQPAHSVAHRIATAILGGQNAE